ncbi:carnitine O-palmitoyltransferase 2, mitochondrial [Trichonephila inaurata madagascariensis]|uniref:Carnitine O-palmitoyltransferase 2, mitochondrial n=1 Tax=Trichonephila inaurata madagascariensis TaxID=2747483 RepID=A0A8X7BS44_9ARAC|nr:carnitine O-palmitoyltransferase 2, mitochondrial [Trichonephila inaurata madagascariensis]
MFNSLKSVRFSNIFFCKNEKLIIISGVRFISVSSKLPGKDKQFLQRSIVPTNHFQDSLPRLPVPELDKTCERYITALKPFISIDKLQNTQQIVEKFKCEEGKELQQELKTSNARNKHTSYITGPWFDMYLKSRVPLVLNFNPFLAFKDDPQPKYNTQLLRSSNMIISSLRFFKSLKANILEPEVFHLNPEKSDTAFFRKTMRLIPRRFAWYGAYLFKAFPLDMSQFNNLFSSTRIPCISKDELQVFPDSRHIVILRNGHFYVFDVLDEDGNIIPSSHIYDHINYILSDTQTPPSHPISVLTTENRDTWAKARMHLEKLGNAEQLRLIDSAIFALALDDETLGNNLVKSAHHMLHGPVHNRWFDKSFTLIITKDAKAALNFEHAWGDGVAVLRYFNEVFTDSTKYHFVGPKTVPANVDASHRVKKLDFILDDAMKSTIKEAQEHFKQSKENLRMDVLQHYNLHRECIKGFKLSPDSVAQLGFQMAFYKLNGKFVATYESCSTSAFKHGRTETVRPLTLATKKCVEEFHKNNRTSNSELKNLLKECSKVHNQLTKEAAMGQGFDRHLFALKNLAEEKGMKLPALYHDPVYAEANHFVLSTSTLFGPAFSGGGFAPVVQDGLGIGYGFLDNFTGCLVSSYTPHRDGAAFVDALHSTYDDIYNVLSKN